MPNTIDTSALLNYFDELDDLRAIHKKNNTLDDSQRERAEKLLNDADDFLAGYGTRNLPAELTKRFNTFVDWWEAPPRAHRQPLIVNGVMQPNKPIGTGGTGLSFKNAATGEIVRALSNNEKLADTLDGFGYQNTPQCSIGEVITGIATGRMSEEAKLSVIGNSGTAGGYLLNPQMSSTFIDLARAASVVMRAGAQTIPMETSELILAKLDTDPTSHWRHEGVSITASEPAFGKIVLKAKVLGCLIPASIELLEDSANAAEVITGAIQKSMAAEIDRVVLNGDGAESEPCGITNTTGINTTTSVGVPGDYVEPTAAVSDILGSNYPYDIEQLCWLQHPDIAAVYDSLSDNTSANRRDPTPWAAAMRRMYSTNLPNGEGAGSNEYSDIYGYFPSVLIGMRTSGVVVEVLNAGSGTDANSKSVNAVSDMLRWIRAYVRLDTAITQPSWFNVASGITTS